jgi:hypothetical protein
MEKMCKYSNPALFMDLLHAVLTKRGQKIIINLKIKRNIRKILIPTHTLCSSVDVEFPVSPTLLSIVFKCLYDLPSVSLSLIFVKICLPKSKWFPESKVKVNVLNVS